MTHKTAKDFDPEVLKLFDNYVHGHLSRRGFLASAAKFALIGLSAEALLEALSPRFAEAQQIKHDDPRIVAKYVEYPSPAGYGTIRGYRVQPAQFAGKLPTVLVVHENRGLNPHIEDIARRLALDNFIAFAPDALFPLGGYPGDEDKARELFKTLDQAKTHAGFIAAANVLKTLPEGNGKVGALFDLIDKSLSDRLTGWHTTTFNMLLALIALHLAAIIFYRWARKTNLVIPMLTGKKEVPAALAAALAPSPRKGLGALRFIVSLIISSTVAWGISDGISQLYSLQSRQQTTQAAANF